MHKGVSTEDEGVVVDPSHRRSSGSTNVSKDCFAGSIGTDAAEIGIVERRLGILVESRMLASNAIVVEVCRGRSIPCYTKAINVEEAIASGNLMLCSDLIGVMREELGKVAGLDLAFWRECHTLGHTGRELAWQESAPRSCISSTLLLSIQQKGYADILGL